MLSHNLFKYLGATLLAGFLLAGCDTVDLDDRLIEMPSVVNTSSRTVLLEEFTGQLCSNCPDAHNVASQLAAQYGDKFVVVSIHGGSFGMSDSYTNFASNFVCLATSEGEDYNNSVGVKAWPAGVVNRTSGILTSDAWAASVRNALEIESKLGIVAEATTDGSEINVSVTLIPSADIAAPRLNVWVVESHIDAFQQDGSTYLTSYEHNHVFRKAITPMSEGFAIDPLRSGIHSQEYSFSTPVVDDSHAHWNISNLSVVVFVDTQSEGVLQAASVEVSTTNQSEDNQ